MWCFSEVSVSYSIYHNHFGHLVANIDSQLRLIFTPVAMQDNAVGQACLLLSWSSHSQQVEVSFKLDDSHWEIVVDCK